MPTDEEIYEEEEALIRAAEAEMDEYNKQLEEDLEPWGAEFTVEDLEDPKPLPTNIDELRNEAARGNYRAAAVLRTVLDGKYKEKKVTGSGGSVRGYGCPDPNSKKTLEELRKEREYRPEVVNEFMLQVTDSNLVPPGVALLLFVCMLTRTQPNYMSKIVPSNINGRAMQLYYFFREAEAWTQVNILLALRDWFIKKEDKAKATTDGPFELYLAPFKQAARAEDAAKAEEESDRQEQDRSEDE